MGEEYPSLFSLSSLRLGSPTNAPGLQGSPGLSRGGAGTLLRERPGRACQHVAVALTAVTQKKKGSSTAASMEPWAHPIQQAISQRKKHVHTQ